MKRSTFAFSAAAAVLLLSRIAGAQSPPPVGNQNDLVLTNGGDFVYVYSDPSIGPAVGTSGVADYPTNDYMWKVWPAKIMRHCSGSMEITGFECSSYGEDYNTPDGAGNNTTLPDMEITTGQVLGVVTADLIEPVQGAGTLVSFGPGGPLYNINVGPVPCPPAGFIYGFRFTIDLLGGVAANPGIFVTANGATDTVVTQFMPGALHNHTAGVGTCLTGNGVLVDEHSGSLGGGLGENQRDSNNDTESAYGGYGAISLTTDGDPNDQVGIQVLEFREQTVMMQVKPSAATVVEEGLAGINYNWAGSGTAGTIGPRIYAAQDIGASCRVALTLSAPLPGCILGNRLGLNPADPLFLPTVNIPIGLVTLTDNGAPAQLNAFDDGTGSMIQLPLGVKPSIPATGTITLAYQGLTHFPGPKPGWTFTQTSTISLVW